jgi:hypothetical protein
VKPAIAAFALLLATSARAYVIPQDIPLEKAAWLGAALDELYPFVEKWLCRSESHRGPLDLIYCRGTPVEAAPYRARFLVEFDNRGSAARILAVGAFSRTSREYQTVYPD